MPRSTRTESARPRRRLVIASVIVALLLVNLVVFGVLWWTRQPPRVQDARPGQCVQQTGDNALAVVACDDPAADFTVVGRLESRTQAEADDENVCLEFGDATSSYWHPVRDDRGVVLCLAPTR